MLLVFLEGLSGRRGSAQTGLRLGIVAHVAFAVFFFEDSHRDIINLLEFPYAIRTRPHVHFRQTVGIGQCSLINSAPPRHEPAPEILETVVRAAAMDYVRGTPEIPRVRIVEIP